MFFFVIKIRLSAINKGGIVYDNGILIDNKFRTKDPNIYAAGPATAYCRKYYAESYKQKYYDSYEIGEKVLCKACYLYDLLYFFLSFIALATQSAGIIYKTLMIIMYY